MEEKTESRIRALESRIELLSTQLRQLEFAVDPENVIFDDGETLVQKLSKLEGGGA